jgi:glycerol-1-phosphate dehydrogenase [NAD(P)+]
MELSPPDHPLPRLLAGRLPDPDGGGLLAVRTRRVVIGTGLAAAAPALVGSLDLPAPLALVADPATWAALGEAVAAALRPTRAVLPTVFARPPQADEAAVAELCQRSAGAASLIAVGSGTINDLTRYTAKLTGRRYGVFGTALSMNGYASENAAITQGGHKRTLAAVAAEGVFLDLDVAAAAPPRLTRAGLGDSICRPTAQTDWLLAHLLLGRPYREAPFALLAADEPRLLADPEGLARGDRAALACLARTLVLSGFGMALCGSSAPASQAEHLISHWLDMRADRARPAAFHGEQIAVTTLTVAALQEAILAGPAPLPATEPLDEATLVARYGDQLGRACWAEVERKRLDGPATAALAARLRAEWPAIAARLRAVGRPAAELRAILARAGAPTRPEDLGLDRATYRRAVLGAREIRDRFTVLDLAALAGRLEELAPS